MQKRKVRVHGRWMEHSIRKEELLLVLDESIEGLIKRDRRELDELIYEN